MSHMVETMAYAGETPWHGLGVHVEENLSVKDMMKAAEIDWGVAKSPMFYDVNGEVINSGKFALFEIQITSSWIQCLILGSLVRTRMRLLSSRSS
jgi:hypothetical protein